MRETRDFGPPDGAPSSQVSDILQGIANLTKFVNGLGARMDLFESGDRNDRRPTADGARKRVHHSAPGRSGRFGGDDYDQGGSNGASALGTDDDDDNDEFPREARDVNGGRQDGSALLAAGRELGHAVQWPEGNGGHHLLVRLLEGDTPVPLPDEAAISTRSQELRRGAQRALYVLRGAMRTADLRAVAIVSLFVDPFAMLSGDAAADMLEGDEGVLLAWLYAEHSVSVRYAPFWSELSVREAYAHEAQHVRAPAQWTRKLPDSTVDLQVCSAAFGGKIPKGFVDSQKLLCALAQGADDALELAACSGGEVPTWQLVIALHKIAALARAGVVANAESLLSQVTGAAAADYKVDARIKVDKALTSRERAELDTKAVLKAQSDATAANEKIAAALVARATLAPKWSAGAKGAASSSTPEAGGAQAPSKRFQKREAAKKGAPATTSANKAVDKSEKSPVVSKGDDAQ